jgi:hypothetical protein
VIDRTTNPGFLRRFFSGLTESTFHGQLGVTDTRLVDYLSELLVRFLRSDAVFGVRGPTGRPLDQVVDMLAEAEARRGEAKRMVHRHIGDFTLFWSGVYPEMIPRLRRHGRKDSLIDYFAQGKRAYYIASTIPLDRESAAPDVLEQLSQQFEMCAYGLGEVRRQWEHLAGGGPDGGAWIH